MRSCEIWQASRRSGAGSSVTGPLPDNHVTSALLESTDVDGRTWFGIRAIAAERQ